MIKIGLIGSQSMHAWSFAAVCNIPQENGEYRFPDARVTAVYGVDDTPEHIQFTMEKGKIPVQVSSLEELCQHCNAFMILQRKGGEHVSYALELMKRGYPVFLDKPACCTKEDAAKLKEAMTAYNATISGGSGLKYNRQVTQLKQQLLEQAFGPVRGGTINHIADRNSPYDGLFFYLPHAVEMMLELFGYEPVSLSTAVVAADNFTVCVNYKDFIVNLAINGSSPCYILVNGSKTVAVQVDASDIYRENMTVFLQTVRGERPSTDPDKLLKHVYVILAVLESMDTGKQIFLN